MNLGWICVFDIPDGIALKRMIRRKVQTEMLYGGTFNSLPRVFPYHHIGMSTEIHLQRIFLFCRTLLLPFNISGQIQIRYVHFIVIWIVFAYPCRTSFHGGRAFCGLSHKDVLREGHSLFKSRGKGGGLVYLFRRFFRILTHNQEKKEERIWLGKAMILEKGVFR